MDNEEKFGVDYRGESSSNPHRLWSYTFHRCDGSIYTVNQGSICVDEDFILDIFWSELCYSVEVEFSYYNSYTDTSHTDWSEYTLKDFTCMSCLDVAIITDHACGNLCGPCLDRFDTRWDDNPLGGF
jgi:hypothetical protein